MRIDRMFLDGFGHFNQRDISSNGSLTVISGANEAGKSTLLSFVRTILFGFPTPSRINEAYPPTAGGRHGGRLTITTDAGDQYTIERYPGTHGGTVNVTGPNGALLDGTILPILVGNASEQLFKSVFAFSLKELQDTGTLKGDEVSGRIYSAGMGVADLPAVQRNIDRAKTAIFAPRGRNPEVATTLRDIGEIESQLDVLATQASEYGQLVSREEEIERELNSTAALRSKLSSRLAELENLSRAWEEWSPVLSREARLNDLPAFDGFPEGAVDRLESLDRQIGEVRPEVQDAEDSLARAQEGANVEIPDESMLEDSEVIESILRGRDSIDASVHDLPERRAELGGMEDSLNQTLRDLGTG
ncbi:MAG: AAA family ATPase, partial [Chloroflexi bacterium]|nr:AAA family ATPase [Chloroflexota bacterium]